MIGKRLAPSPTTDYADQRYYSVGTGRFNSPDPYRNSAGRRDPGSWNRYAYVGGDPINFTDPGGNQRVCVGPSDDRTCWDEPDPSPSGPEPRRRNDLPEIDRVSNDQDSGGVASTNGQRLPYAKHYVDQALAHSDCSRIFGTAPDIGSGLFGLGPTPTASQVFDSIAGEDGTYGKIVFGTPSNPNANASTQPSLSSMRLVGIDQIVFTYNTITINTATLGGDSWNSGTLDNNAVTLLHELGHALSKMGWTKGLFIDNDDDKGSNSWNTSIINSNCAKFFQ